MTMTYDIGVHAHDHQSRLKRFVFGSAAEKVVRASDVPVLLVTPPDR
ncbi:MAG: universal stress protein [Gemmatimonadaceae bacterium]